MTYRHTSSADEFNMTPKKPYPDTSGADRSPSPHGGSRQRYRMRIRCNAVSNAGFRCSRLRWHRRYHLAGSQYNRWGISFTWRGDGR